MKRRPPRSWSSLFFWCALLGLCALFHGLALAKMEPRIDGGSPHGPDGRRMMLIDFVHTHPELALGYALLFAAVLVHGIIRRHPWWALGATFAVLAAPWVVYLNVCTHIAMKLVRLR